MEPITFPTTVAEFVTYQGADINKKLDENGREAAETAIELFNLSYASGLNGCQCAASTVDECIAKGVFSPPKTTTDRQFLESLVFWNNLAYCQGCRDRGARS